MILLFLGSWRSTVIIAISIPLAILSAIIALAATGNTLNIMTLGGLSLAVGILVDDATVTIENINWHLEQGKGVTQAILDGAAQIVTPAFVSLLCICIVFVPMFFLPGVAGFLFVPLALAVVFAMIASFVLSRTLVPTMAMYLLKPHLSGHDEHAAGSPGSRNPVIRFQRGFEARFEDIRLRYGGLLERALGAPKPFIFGFLGVVLLSFLLLPFLGENFFPSVDAGQMAIHARRADRITDRGHVGRVRPHRAPHPPDHPARRAGLGGRQCRPAGELDQHDLQQFRHDRAAGRRHPDPAHQGSPPDRGLRAGAARDAAAGVSRHDLLVPARRRSPARS